MYIDDEYINKYFYSDLGNFKRTKINNIPDEIYKYLLNRYADSESIKETIFRIYHKIDIRPVCKHCGNKVIFRGKSNRSYDVYCSKECKYSSSRSNEYTKTCLEKYGTNHYSQTQKFKDKIKQTCLEKYGTEFVLSNKDIRNKIKQTCIKKYGTNSTGNVKDRINKVKQTWKNKSKDDILNITNKIKQTKLQKYANENYTNLEKYKQTCLKKYNVRYYFQSNDFKDKYKHSCLQKYGVDNPLKSKNIQNKIKHIFIEKYGVDNPYKSNIIKDKIKLTCLNKYGVDSYSKTNEYKQQISKILSSKEIQDKINNTKQRNNSFNTSKPEDKSYILLKEKYPDVQKQYRSEPYPFNCDFYIPSLDLYIECNYHWTHGGHPYNENNKEVTEIINKWKE